VIILPLFFSVTAGLFLSFVLPKVYQASTTILVQPQQVPKDYVRAALPEEGSRLEQDTKLSMIAQQVFTTQILERVISDFDLYSDPDNMNISMKSKIDRLRSNIMIALMEEGLYSNAYIISFKGEDPQTVMEVTNSLVTYLIDANTKEQESSAMETSDFLGEELETTRIRLRGMEETLKKFRERFMGELPEQLNSNLNTLERLQSQLNDKEDTLRSIRLDLSNMDKQIEEDRYSQVLNSLGRKEEILEMDTTDVGLLKEQLANLLTRYTEQHPDVRRLKSKIAQLEAEIKAEKESSAIANRSAFKTSQTRYLSQLELRRDALQNEKVAVEIDIAGLKREMANYQKRVENIPKREQEYLTLKRDYDNLNELYNSLLKRKLEAEMTVNMERQQKGEQYKLIHSARFPKRPVEPNLKLMIILSIALGLGLGSGLALLLENMSGSYKEPEEIETELKLPVIAAIPRVLTRRDIFMKRTEVTLCSLVLIITVTGICAFAFVTLVGTDQAIENVRQYLSI
jgi:polysaccharide chain length determinant protein (PEP-CTERM system associated)